MSGLTGEVSDLIDDGGPAFPLRVEFPTTGPHHELGMSLRDWFAGRAMQGMLSAPAASIPSYVPIARWAYEFADAMLAQRKKGPPRDGQA